MAHMQPTETDPAKIPEYGDDGSLRPQDQVGLDEFLLSSDRAERWALGAQPFFSGRVDEINAFRNMLLLMSRPSAKDGAQNLACLFQGAPGAGKSALLSQLGYDMGRLPDVEGIPWLPVRLAPAAAGSPHAIERAANRAAAGRLARSGDRAIQRAADQSRSILERGLSGQAPSEEIRGAAVDLLGRVAQRLGQPPGPQAAADWDRQAMDLLGQARGEARRALQSVIRRGFGVFGVTVGPAPGDPDEGIADLVDANPGFWHGHRIVLFIDEAQSLDLTDRKRLKAILQTAYLGEAGASIGLCFGGLSDARAVLEECGISRFSRGRARCLEALPGTDSRNVLRRAFERFGVRNGDPWVRALAGRSSGWPQHLQGYLQAALKALRDSGMDAAQADFRRVVRWGDEGRRDYYNDRLALLGDRAALARRAAGAMRGAPEAGMSHESLAEAMGMDPYGTEFTYLIARAVHAGVLAEGKAPGLWRVPIPSFAAHLLDQPPEPVPRIS